MAGIVVINYIGGAGIQETRSIWIVAAYTAYGKLA